MSRFAEGLTPPYYAVIFTAQQSDDIAGYPEMAEAMVRLAGEQDGFLGIESTRDATGLGVTVSYWRDEAAVAGWRAHAKHLLAQKLGKDRWYSRYELRVAKVDRAYAGPEGR